jgi:hypothetical protein
MMTVEEFEQMMMMTMKLLLSQRHLLQLQTAMLTLHYRLLIHFLHQTYFQQVDLLLIVLLQLDPQLRRPRKPLNQ